LPDRLAGGAQHGVDLLAPGKERRGFQAILERVLGAGGVISVKVY
jgi:hypothetical protein